MKKDKLNTLSDRLLYALEVTGAKKADLARAIDVQPQTIQHLCHGAVQSSRFTFELATALGLSTHWLATGLGEMFLADDPEHKLFKEYKKIPILDSNQLVSINNGEDLAELNVAEYSVLKTDEGNVFCTVMNDASMTPMIQAKAEVFFKRLIPISREKLKQGTIVIAYLSHFDSIIIREIIINKNTIYLSPQNKNLFKEIELNKDVSIFGEAIEYHCSIKQKQP